MAPKLATRPSGTAAANPQPANVPAAVSFMDASEQTAELFGSFSAPLQAAIPTPVTDLKVPTFGFMRSLVMIVEAVGGTSTEPAVAKEDGPFSVIDGLQLAEPNGRALVGPMSGYLLYLANKWFPTSSWQLDAKLNSYYQAPSAAGNFRFALRVPVEVGGRDPLGALSNQQGDSRFRVSYTINPATSVYSTAPDGTLPTIRVSFIYEAWAPVAASTPEGASVQVLPAFHGTTQHLSVSTPDVAAGEKKVGLTRVGNLIRGLLVVTRDTNGARTDAAAPDFWRLSRDNKYIDQVPSAYTKYLMGERTGQTADTGVYVIFDGEHDLDGRVGQGTRSQWMRTSSSTRLELEGTWKAGTAATLTVLTNDVKPAAGLVSA